MKMVIFSELSLIPNFSKTQNIQYVAQFDFADKELENELTRLGLKTVVADFNLSSYWKILGWLGAIAGLMILSYYSVFAGIAAAYIFNFMPSNETDQVAYSLNYFSKFVGSPILTFGKLRLAYGEVGVEPPPYNTQSIYVSPNYSDS